MAGWAEGLTRPAASSIHRPYWTWPSGKLSAQLDHIQPHALQQTPLLFDHLIGKHQKRFRYREPKGLGSLEIDVQCEIGWLYDRQVGRFFPS
jgi:hypothetical protein